MAPKCSTQSSQSRLICMNTPLHATMTRWPFSIAGGLPNKGAASTGHVRCSASSRGSVISFRSAVEHLSQCRMRHDLAAFGRSQCLRAKGDVTFAGSSPPEQQIAVHVQHGFRNEAAMTDRLRELARKREGCVRRHRLAGENGPLAIDILDVVHGGKGAALRATIYEHGLLQGEDTIVLAADVKLGLIHLFLSP